MSHGTGGTVSPASGWKNSGATVSITAHRLTATVSPVGAGAELAHFPGRTIRLRLQWADPSHKRRLSLIIDADTCGRAWAVTNLRRQ